MGFKGKKWEMVPGLIMLRKRTNMELVGFRDGFRGLVHDRTIPLPPEKQIAKITVLGVAPLLGEAIKRIHRNESVSRLFV